MISRKYNADSYDPIAAQGQVLSLASAGEFLFSGGQEGAVAVWKFDQTTQNFVSAVNSPPPLCSTHS